jgi:hypothetical protein
MHVVVSMLRSGRGSFSSRLEIPDWTFLRGYAKTPNLNIKMVSAFLALGVNPQAKSSSWLTRRLKIHLQALGFVATPGPVVAKEPVEVAVQGPAEVTGQEPATEQQEPTVEPKAKATKKAAKKE